MNKYILKIGVFIFLGLLHFIGFSQKKFSATIEWPKGLITKKIEIYYNTGIKEIKIEPGMYKNEVTISDSFSSKKATIVIVFDSSNYQLPNYNAFYVSQKKAKISFVANIDSRKKPSVLIKTLNADDLSEISKKYKSFISSEENKRNSYVDSHDALDSGYFSIYQELIIKKLAFIKMHKNSYYAFQLFKNEICPITFPFQDTVLDGLYNFYTTTFNEDLKQSIEGYQIVGTLKNKMIATHENIEAPDFTSTDIFGNIVRLTDLRGRFILINFWATWCKPCIAELPAIKMIRDKYPVDSLTIISVSYDKDSSLFTNARIQYKMNWINIFRDDHLGVEYGGRSALPMLFLIDSHGTIIYNRNAGTETDFENLSVLNAILKKYL